MRYLHLCVCFVSSEDNLSDVFTKPLIAPLFQAQQRKLMVISSFFCLKRDVEDDTKCTASVCLKTIADRLKCTI